MSVDVSRQECMYITLTPSVSFQVSGPSTSIAGVSADDCSQDYVVIQAAASALSSPAANTHDRSILESLNLNMKRDRVLILISL